MATEPPVFTNCVENAVITPSPLPQATGRYLKKRESILNAAALLFNEQGTNNTMLSEVALRVGLSTNSITYYFKKKEDLIVACLGYSIETIIDIAKIAGERSTEVERTREFLKLFFKKMKSIAEGGYPEMISFRDIRGLEGPQKDHILAAYSEMFRWVRKLLLSGIVTSENRIALNVRTHMLMTQIQWIRTWIAAYDLKDYDRLAEHMSDILIGGIASSGSVWEKCALDDRLMPGKLTSGQPKSDFLNAAIELINGAGYGGASIDRISAMLNVTKGAFYHHNLSKEELISECAERTFFIVQRICSIADSESATGWEKLSCVARSLVSYHFSEHGPLLRISAWRSPGGNVNTLREDVRPLNQLVSLCVDFLVEGMKDGSIRPLHQPVASAIIIGMINGSTVLNLWVPDALKLDPVDLYVRPLFTGILVG